MANQTLQNLKKNMLFFKESVILVGTKLVHWKVNENIGKVCIVNGEKEKFIFWALKKKLNIKQNGFLAGQVMLKEIKQ